MRLKLSIFLLAAFALAQTNVKPPQLVPAPVSGTLLGIVGNRFAQLVLDPASFVIDSSTTPATIRLISSSASVEAVEIMRPTTAQTSFTLASTPVGVSLQVARNGVVQASQDDYTITGRIVTMASVSGDIIQFRYRQ